jgi:hypothetical protein
MDLSKGDLELSSSAIPPPGSDRRTFLRSLAAGVAIAVPAVRVLASGPQASAKVIPHAAECSSTHEVYHGHTCTAGGTGCPVGDAGSCIGHWSVVSNITGRVCSTFVDNEGPCGTNTCGGVSTAASAAC